MSNDLHNQIRSTIRRALYATLGIPLLALPVALGQQATNQTAAATAGAPVKMEKTVVTGSLIPTAETVGPTPVQSVSVEDIQKAGTSDVMGTLRKLVPGFQGAGNYVGLVNNNTLIYTGQQGFTGESSIALRNLPTLILIDGRRVAYSALSAGQAVDLNTIPLSMVDRVEVLSDGASALYGSDAIGGVVNIITKKDWNGVEIAGRVGFATEHTSNDFLEYQASLVAGASNERARFVAGVQYYHSDPLFAKDRNVASAGIAELADRNITPPAYVSPSYPGRVQNGGVSYILAGSPFATGAAGYLPGLNAPPAFPGQHFTNAATAVIDYNNYAIANGYTVNGQIVHQAPYIPIASTPLGTQLEAVGQGEPLWSALNTTLFGTTSILELDRRSYSGNFEYDLFEKKATIFGSFMYADNKATGQLAPSPVPFLSLYGIAVPANNPQNPFGIDLGAGGAGDPRIRSRFVDSGNRTFVSQTDFYRFVGGLKGDISPEYSYDAAYNYSRSSQTQQTRNAINGAFLNQAFQPTGAVDAQGQPLSQLTDEAGVNLPLYNIFALSGQDPGTLKRLNTTLFSTGLSELWNVEGHVNGSPVELAAGPLQFAVGGSYSFESLKLDFDGLQLAGLVPGLNAATPFKGGTRDRAAGFIEVKVPIFSENNEIPVFHAFELTAAGRYESINPGGDAAVPKVGARWQPVDEQLTLRGGYSQGFVAPSIFNLFGPDSVSNPVLSLPVPGSTNNAMQAGQVTTQTRSNPNLESSDSRQFNAGVVYSPKGVPGLTVGVDYYNVEQDKIPIADPVAAAHSLNTLGSNSPYNNGPLGFYTDAFTGAPLATPAPNQVGVGTWGNLIFPYQGTGKVRTDGLDFTVSYAHPIEQWKSKITVTGNANWVLNYDFQNDPSLPFYSYVGQYTQGWGGSQGLIPDYTAFGSLAWEYRELTFVASVNYIPSVDNPGFLFPYVGDSTHGSTVDGSAQKIDSYYTIDLQLSYEFGKGKTEGKTWYDSTRLTVGCRNVNDADVPFIAGAVEDNTDKNNYDILGRFVYFEVAKKF